MIYGLYMWNTYVGYNGSHRWYYFKSWLTKLFPLSTVERSDNKFKQMIQEAHSCDPAKQIYQLKSQEFQGAKFESMMRFLRRIKIVVETRPTYRKEVAGKCMVGILGAEDAGKSTFIKVNDLFLCFQNEYWSPQVNLLCLLCFSQLLIAIKVHQRIKHYN